MTDGIFGFFAHIEYEELVGLLLKHRLELAGSEMAHTPITAHHLLVNTGKRKILASHRLRCGA